MKVKLIFDVSAKDGWHRLNREINMDVIYVGLPIILWDSPAGGVGIMTRVSGIVFHAPSATLHAHLENLSSKQDDPMARVIEQYSLKDWEVNKL